MKTSRYSKLMAAVLLTGAPLFWSACSDTWDDHYEAQEGTMASQSSLLENIESNPGLANFLKVIKAIGGSETLNSPQQLTVWAPLNMTSAQADSVIAVYQQGVAQGLKLDDNKAITQFMQNHVARSPYSKLLGRIKCF